MDDAYFLSLGFERWAPPLPLQTTMYVHAHAAQDGARLFMAIPKNISAPDPTEEYRQLTAVVEAFFAKHGGRLAERVPERLAALY